MAARVAPWEYIGKQLLPVVNNPLAKVGVPFGTTVRGVRDGSRIEKRERAGGWGMGERPIVFIYLFSLWGDRSRVMIDEKSKVLLF